MNSQVELSYHCCCCSYHYYYTSRETEPYAAVHVSECIVQKGCCTQSGQRSRQQAWELWPQLFDLTKMLNISFKHCHCLKGRVELAGESGEKHRDKMEQDPTATSPRGLQGLWGRGKTDTAPSFDPGERELRTEGHTGKCELGYKSKKEMYTSSGRYNFQGNVWQRWLWPQWCNWCLGIYTWAWWRTNMNPEKNLAPKWILSTDVYISGLKIWIDTATKEVATALTSE